MRLRHVLAGLLVACSSSDTMISPGDDGGVPGADMGARGSPFPPGMGQSSLEHGAQDASVPIEEGDAAVDGVDPPLDASTASADAGAEARTDAQTGASTDSGVTADSGTGDPGQPDASNIDATANGDAEVDAGPCADSDNDTVCDEDDECPDADDYGPDSDDDGVVDACDQCEGLSDYDGDSNGYADACDVLLWELAFPFHQSATVVTDRARATLRLARGDRQSPGCYQPCVEDFSSSPPLGASTTTSEVDDLAGVADWLTGGWIGGPPVVGAILESVSGSSIGPSGGLRETGVPHGATLYRVIAVGWASGNQAEYRWEFRGHE